MQRPREVASGSWMVDDDAVADVAYAALADDRVWNAFGIAGLEPPFREFTRVAVAQHAAAASSAACLIFHGSSFNMIVPHGNPAGVAAILERVELPSPTGVMVRPEQLAAIEQRYSFPNGRSQMIRMAVKDERLRPQPAVSGLVRLGPANLDEVQDLYRAFPENHFAPIQLEYGVFFGVRVARRLVAIGGTHVVAVRYGIGVLGGIFTLPAVRQRGFAGAITSALVTALLDCGCRDVVLTVHSENAAARRVYQRLGFREHCRYETGEAIARS